MHVDQEYIPQSYPYHQANRVLSRIASVGEILPTDELNFYVEWLRNILRSDVCIEKSWHGIVWFA